jgi:hypothetical protein
LTLASCGCTLNSAHDKLSPVKGLRAANIPMNKLTDNKAIADFKKKHLDASRERWLKSVYEKARRLPEPDLASLTEAVKGKKKPDSKEKEICDAVEKIHDLAEKVEDLGKTFAEIRTPTKPTITDIQRPVAGPADVLNLLAAGLLLGALANKVIQKLEKS